MIMVVMVTDDDDDGSLRRQTTNSNARTVPAIGNFASGNERVEQ